MFYVCLKNMKRECVMIFPYKFIDLTHLMALSLPGMVGAGLIMICISIILIVKARINSAS